MAVNRIKIGGSAPSPDRQDYDLVAGVGVTVAASDDSTNNQSIATIATLVAADAGLSAGTPFVIKVPMTAGSGTSADLTATVPIKARLIDTKVNTVTAVTSSVVEVFTAASGGGTACSSSISTAAAGVARDALTTATQVFAAGATVYVHQSAGATLAGGEVYLTFLPEV